MNCQKTLFPEATVRVHIKLRRAFNTVVQFGAKDRVYVHVLP